MVTEKTEDKYANVDDDSKECPNCQIEEKSDQTDQIHTEKEDKSEKSDQADQVHAEKKMTVCPSCNKYVNVNDDSKECPNCHSLLFLDKKSVDQRMEKIKSYNLGQILLREREYLFEKIYQEEDLKSQIKFFTLYSLLFSFVYGASVGMYSGYWQIISSGVKVPLMLFGTLVVCLPALFTFNILLGSKLSLGQTLSMLLVSTYLISAIMISFAPILLFFHFFHWHPQLFLTFKSSVLCNIRGVRN